LSLKDFNQILRPAFPLSPSHHQDELSSDPDPLQAEYQVNNRLHHDHDHHLLLQENTVRKLDKLNFSTSGRKSAQETVF
jgi:hypothetical protein